MLVRSFGAPSSLPSPRSCRTALAALLLAAIGASAAQAQAVGGSWSAVFDWSPQLVPLAPAGCVSDSIGHAALIPTGVHRGKVLIWNAVSPVTGNCHVTTKTFLFDPASPSNLIELIHPPLASMVFCSGTTWDADGNLKVVGGEDQPGGGYPGKTYEFLPGALGAVLPGSPPSISAPRAWSQLGDFQVELNYPTVSTLIALDFASTCSSGPAYGPGGTFVQGGRPVPCQGIETWGFMRRRATDWSCPVQPTYPTFPTVYPLAWMGTHGITGTLGIDFLEYVPVATNPLDASTYPRVLFDTYPVGFQISTGEIVRVGDRDKVTGTPGCGGIPAVNDPGDVWVVRPHYNPLLPGWELHRGPTLPLPHSPVTDGWEWGSAVIMYTREGPAESEDRILRFGGVDPVADASDPPTATLAAVWEFEPGSNPSSGTWRPKAPLTYARAWTNAVTLPTGQVFIVGGEHNHVAPPVGGPQFVPELYDPGRAPTDLGSTLDLAMPTSVPPTLYPTPRRQHAVAILLPDARVLVAGGDDEDPTQYVASEHTGEIYSPPYLFYGFRPTILQAAATANFSDGPSIQSFSLSAQISPANSIERVVLIRPGAVTHHFDADQRYIELAFSVDQVTVPNPPVVQNVQLSVQSPDKRVGPPGRYMLFAIEKEPGPAGRRAPSVAEVIDVQVP